MYISEIACLVWEIIRLRRCKKQILNKAFLDRLRYIFKKQCTEYDERDTNTLSRYEYVDEEKLEFLYALADRWITDASTRQEVPKLLDGFEVDDAEIEASVIGDLLNTRELDGAIAALEFRRDKAINCLDGYRHQSSIRAKKSIESVKDGESVDIPRLEDKSRKKSAA
jgi:hypothetical protein